MRIIHAGGSGEERPTPEQMRQWHRLMSPPDNEFPAEVGLTAVLGRTDDAAVGITQMEAFSTGFQFTLAVRLRQARPELVGGNLFMLISSHARPGVEVPLDQRLLLGVEYADGRRASTLRDFRMRGPGEMADDQQRLVLVQHGGGGGDRTVDQNYWVSPLPPDGPVTLVLTWAAFGMPESRTVLDGGTIRSAAERSLLLWPPQPDIERPEPPPPPRPSSGWFAEPSG